MKFIVIVFHFSSLMLLPAKCIKIDIFTMIECYCYTIPVSMLLSPHVGGPHQTYVMSYMSRDQNFQMAALHKFHGSSVPKCVS